MRAKATGIRVIHRSTCEAAFRSHDYRAKGKDCSHCRNSECKPDNATGKWGFVCRLAHAVMDATQCADFKDARRFNYINSVSPL